MSEKQVKVIRELAKEIYGEAVSVESHRLFDQQYVDIYKHFDYTENVEVSISHPKAFELMIELLRNMKKINTELYEDADKRNRKKS